MDWTFNIYASVGHDMGTHSEKEWLSDNSNEVYSNKMWYPKQCWQKERGVITFRNSTMNNKC